MTNRKWLVKARCMAEGNGKGKGGQLRRVKRRRDIKTYETGCDYDPFLDRSRSLERMRTRERNAKQVAKAVAGDGDG